MSADDDFGSDDCRGTVFIGVFYAIVGWLVALGGAWVVWSYVLSGGK